VLATFSLGGAGAEDALRPSPLAERLQQELSTPEPGSEASGVRWGALVTRLDGTVLFATNAHTAFIPASNTKLFIAALALDQLGAEARLRTPVHVAAAPDADGTLASDLWVVGQGDPTPGTAPRAGPMDSPGTWDMALEPWVDRWRSRGLRRIDGDLVMCDGAVRVPEYGPGWDAEDRAEWYAAPVSAFVVNDNTFRLTALPGSTGTTSVPFRVDPPLPSLEVTWAVFPGTNATHHIRYGRTGPGRPIEVRGRFATGTNAWSAELAVAHPAQVFGELLRRTLERRGVRVSGGVRVDHSGVARPPLAWDEWTSAPLGDRLGLCLKPSQNLHAQLLLAEVGRAAEQAARSPGSRTPTPPDAGVRAVGHDAWGLAQMPRLLQRAGIAPDEVHLEEGSGLSRSNRVSPAATVALLRFMARNADQRVWKESLPLAGVDGTLRRRFQTGRAHRSVRAKTGSLRGVHALGGYVTTADGEEWVFAIYANGAQGSPQARARMDRWVELLAGADASAISPPASPDPPR
jgi:D-alanyl-D-alanine carboxypeptidase/D-alanyl-D-alanine-endopeptidase (penicillin-binding protein 4)